MLKNKLIRCILAFALVCSFVTFAAAQSSGRRTIQQVKPNYPDLARKMKVTGTVRVEAVVGSDGHVKSASAVTGHPLLKDAAVSAVRSWTFEPGREETTVVAVDFQI